MNEFINGLFSGTGFMPHGMCYLWRPDVLSLHVISDSLITLSYFSIPFTLLYFVRKRRDLEFDWMFICFAVFIVACGTTHLMEIWVIWHPAYWLSGAIKAVTALASVPTAILLVRLIPSALRLPSPAVLRVANNELQREVAERKRAELEVRRINEELEERVRERTLELEVSNRSLRESEARVRAVLNAAPSAVVAIDKEGKIIEWNPRAETAFGWWREYALGKQLGDLIVPEKYRQAHSEGIERYSHTTVSRVLDRIVELTAMRSDGSEFPVELSISPLVQGDAVTFCGFITDITERKQSQSKLHAQLNNLDLLRRITRGIGERQDLNSIYQVVLDSLEDNLPVDFVGACSYAEGSQTLIVERLGNGSSSLALELAMTEQTRIEVAHNGLELLRQGEMVCQVDIGKSTFAVPLRLAVAGFNTLMVAPLMAENRLFGALLLARRDKAGFNDSEHEFVRQLCEHVALAVHQAQLYATLQQTYEELHQSQQNLLQQARLSALGQMASGVAHDINNAISPATLYTDALLENEVALDDRVRGYLTTIRRAIEDVSLTVNRMREFYRPQDSHAALVMVDLNKLIPQVVDLTEARWRNQPQERGDVIELQLDLSSHPVLVNGAENEIRDALTNLIFNAVDAMPNGGTLILRTSLQLSSRHAGSAADAKSIVEVIDTGVGMSEEVRRHCLEPFFTTKGDRGTGLGLAMVYGMTQRHAAKLAIESEPGRGTCVRLEFPRAYEPHDAAIKEPFATSIPRCLRLLLVDDDAVLIESLSDILQRDGHHVTAASGGQAGIEAFIEAQRRALGFDAVITDLGMPYVDGRRVAAAVKAVSLSTPVIMLTGWAQRLLDDGEIPPHVDRLLTKPPKLQILRETLATLTAISSQPPRRA